MGQDELFSEEYRIVAVNEQNLVVRGEQSGKLLTINNASLGTLFSAAEYPVGKLIKLTDPSKNAQD